MSLVRTASSVLPDLKDRTKVYPSLRRRFHSVAVGSFGGCRHFSLGLCLSRRNNPERPSGNNLYLPVLRRGILLLATATCCLLPPPFWHPGIRPEEDDPTYLPELLATANATHRFIQTGEYPVQSLFGEARSPAQNKVALILALSPAPPRLKEHTYTI